MRSHAKASTAGSTKGSALRRPSGIALLCAGALAALLGTGAPAASAACPNEEFRVGMSASLPGCRAYEFVTPPSSNGLVLESLQAGGFLQDMFPTEPASPSRDSVVFQSSSGALSEPPEATGNSDVYESVRSEAGWQTVRRLTPSGAQAVSPVPGGVESGHRYAFVTALPPAFSGGGSLAPELPSNYLSNPDGSVEPIGIGSLGTELLARGRFISPGGSHIIFETSQVWGEGFCSPTPGCPQKQLEPDAPPSGTTAIYDRSADGPTRVVSLLPGDITPNAGDEATYQAVAADGSVVQFAFNESNPAAGEHVSYIRVDNNETLEVGSGSALTVGATLTCSTTGATNSFQWLRNGAPIGGATSPTYTTTAADEGKVVQCQVTSTNVEGGSRKASGTVTVASAPTITPPAAATPTISGTLSVGMTLTCNTGVWQGSPTFSYQWLRNGAPIATATASTYVLQAADKGTAIQCEVTGANTGGTAVADSFNSLILALPPTASANPSISGTVAVGETLTCNNGTWANSPSFGYEWLRSGTPIGGATAQTYVLAAADEGKPVQCRVTASNADSTAQAVSPSVVVPPPPGTTPPSQTAAGTVTGTPNVGNALTCNTGTWTGSPTFARQWLRNGVAIGGATGNTYTLVAGDREKSIQCMVTATNAGGSVVAVNASATNGSRYVTPKPPVASATVPTTTLTPAGISADGTYVYYVQAGNVIALNTKTDSHTVVAGTGHPELVNISSDGSHVYFLSTSQLDGSKGTSGQPNLYVWTTAGQTIEYIATVAPADLAASPGLNKWIMAVTPVKSPGETGPGAAASRTTPDGSVLIFESRAQLTGYDNGGNAEIYRYDDASKDLQCVSCNPLASPASSGARLEQVEGHPQITELLIHNLSDDGGRVFFETSEALVGRDTDGVNDIYEWNAASVPQVGLISSGQSKVYGGLFSVLSPNTIFAITPDGRDVDFISNDRLLPLGPSEGSVAIYDARVDGGFAEEATTQSCAGDECQGSIQQTPSLAALKSNRFAGKGNVKAPKRRCRRGRAQKGKATRQRSCHRRRHRGHRRPIANGSTTQGGVR